MPKRNYSYIRVRHGLWRLARHALAGCSKTVGASGTYNPGPAKAYAYAYTTTAMAVHVVGRSRCTLPLDGGAREHA